MQITRTSMVSGVTRTIELDVTQDQLDKYEAGALLQNAFPNLSPDQREFLKTGITDEEWQVLFRNDEDVEEMARLDAEADARLLQQEE
jgi:hypothetical protein